MGTVSVHRDVEEALRDGRPVVALETAVLTHGLPAEVVPGIDPGPAAVGWEPELPLNLATVRAMQATVRAGGAVPAVIAVVDGVLRIGLDDDTLAALASGGAEKASVSTLAGVIARGASAGTTVAATLLACVRTDDAPIRFLATGGIGGVHADWQTRRDVSADLLQLHATPVCTVCSGAKSILDVPATLETLETLGVPVVGFGTDHFPYFHAQAGALPVPQRVENAADAARLCRVHWADLGRTSGIVLAVPVPAAAPVRERGGGVARNRRRRPDPVPPRRGRPAHRRPEPSRQRRPAGEQRRHGGERGRCRRLTVATLAFRSGIASWLTPLAGAALLRFAGPARSGPPPATTLIHPRRSTAPRRE
jgi:pseudouridine-5'-phosphate glycosidase